MLVNKQESVFFPRVSAALMKIVRAMHDVVLKSTIHGVSATELNKLEKQMHALLLAAESEKERRDKVRSN